MFFIFLLGHRKYTLFLGSQFIFLSIDKKGFFTFGSLALFTSLTGLLDLVTTSLSLVTILNLIILNLSLQKNLKELIIVNTI